MTLGAFIWLAVRVLLTALIGVFVLHRLHLLMRLWFCRRTVRTGAPSEGESWPEVTVQLPVYNERFVVARLLAAVEALDYPCQHLQIQVLDDSDDATCEVVDEGASRLRARGFDVDVRRRVWREGFKAGALSAGLDGARGELVAVFDADFVPDVGFLRRLVPILQENAEVGMVQGRWGYLNADANWLTRVQALLLDAHFRIEHEARWRSGCCFNFNGTAGIWRRECIDAAGGWQGDTLTEDLDLSYRAQRLGWRFVYVDSEVAPSELPADWNAFKAQQFRWAKGAIQTARKLLGRLWDADSCLSTRARFEATLHLTSNLAYLAFGALLLGGVAVAASGAAAQAPAEGWWWLRGVGVSAMAVALVFFATPLFLGHRGRSRVTWRDWVALVMTLPVAIGLAVNNGRAVIEGWLGKVSAFERTPKVGDPDARPVASGGGDALPPATAETQNIADGAVKGYRAAGAIGSSVLEIGLGIGFAGLVGVAFTARNWFDLLLLLAPATGFLWVGIGSLMASLSPRRRPWQWLPTQGKDTGERTLRDRGEKSVDVSAQAP